MPLEECAGDGLRQDVDVGAALLLLCGCSHTMLYAELYAIVMAYANAMLAHCHIRILGVS